MKFAITYFSPIHPEMEICRRIEKASKKIGHECFFIGADGICFQNNQHISEIQPEFLIVFDPAHYTLFDVFTYHLLWFVPGLVNTQHAILYNSFSRNCEDHLGFPSEKAIEYYRDFYGDINLNYLFPSVPKDYVLPPKKFEGEEKYKAFYAGINVDSKTVRHEKVFRYLDKKGLVQLYGPKSIEGKKNWEGFSSYKGEIKFDGHSLMETANSVGITLALHHEAHASFSMPTNRLFEGLAAGTLVITDKMSFVEQTFGDSVFLIDFDLSEEKKAEEIEKIILWARSNPEEARKKIIKAQEIFLEKFELSKIVGRLCDEHRQRKQLLLDNSLAACKKQKVSVVCEIYDLASLKTITGNILNQDYPYLEILFLCSCELDDTKNELIKKIEDRFPVKSFYLKESRKYADKSRQNVFQLMKEEVSGEKIIFCEGLQHWRSNHIRTLVEKSMRDLAEVVYSGLYYLNPDRTQAPWLYQPIQNLRDKVISCVGDDQNRFYQSLHREFLKSSVIFDSKLLSEFPESKIKFLVGYEHIGLLVHAFLRNYKIVYSDKLTVFLDESPFVMAPEFQKEIYYKPIRLNQRMSLNSLQFVMVSVLAGNKDFENLIAKFSSNIDSSNVGTFFDSYNYGRFKRKLKFALFLTFGVALVGLGLACYSVFFD